MALLIFYWKFLKIKIIFTDYRRTKYFNLTYLSKLEISKDDYLLIPKLIRGDVLAFDSLYKNMGNYIFALKYLKSEIEAEEIVQSVFVKVWENRKH